MSEPSAKRAKNWQNRVESLIEDQDFEAARSQLSVMINWEDDELAEYVTWAEQRFLELQKRKHKEQVDLEELTKTIRKCFKRHEYRQVLVFLDSIPREDLTDKLIHLRRKAEDRVARVEELESELHNVRKLGDQAAMLAVCEELLDLKPSHKEAGDYYERLTTTSGSGRVIKRGRQKPGDRKEFKEHWALKTILLVSIPCAVITLGLMFLYLKLGTIEVNIQFTDSVKGADITVLIDNEPIEHTEDLGTVKLKPGIHTLTVTRNGKELQSVQFNVIRGEQNNLVVAVDSTLAENNKGENHNPAVTDSPTIFTGTFQPGQSAGDLWSANGLSIKFRWCPPGTFTMGSPSSEKDRNVNEAQVKVTLTKGFWLGQHEVTQGEWENLMGTTPWKDKKFVKEGSQFAANYVSWHDAVKFCEKLTEQERKAGRLPADWAYRLPTEAQWEYACRAGTTARFSFGDDESKLSEYAWWGGGLIGDGNAKNARYVHEVGGRRPNGWNLYDMHGNVWDWCRDWYASSLPGGTDPEVTQQARGRVRRGGGWGNDGRYCRSAIRGHDSPGHRDNDFGFRVAVVQSSR